MGDPVAGNDFPPSFFDRETTVDPPTEETVDASYSPPTTSNDYNAVTLKQLAKPGGAIRPEDLTTDGKIPAHSIIRKQVTRECGYVKTPGPELQLVESNGCEVWRFQRACSETTKVSWLLQGRWVPVGESVQYLPVTVRLVRRCPGGTPQPIPEQEGSILTYTPAPSQDLDPGDIARFREADAEVVGGGAISQVRRDVFWTLRYPLYQVSECTGVATYVLMVRTQTVTMPGGQPVGPDTITEYTPAQTHQEQYRVPNCPKGNVSATPSRAMASIDSGETTGEDDSGDDEEASGQSATGYAYDDGTVVTERTDGSTLVEFPKGDEVEVPGPLSRWEEYWIGFLSGPRRVAGSFLIVGAGLALGLGLAGHGDSTTVAISIQKVVTPVPTAAPSPVASQPSVTGGSLCVVGEGSTSLIEVGIVTNTADNESLSGSLSTAGGAPITGSGQITNGTGKIPFTITQFGSYGPLTLTGSTGQAVPVGPMSSLFPFAVVSDSQPCVTAGASTPSPPTATSPVAPATPKTTTSTTTTTATKSTPPWSWGATGGALLVGLGLLWTRRRAGPEEGTEAAEAGDSNPTDPRAIDRQRLAIDNDGYWRDYVRREYRHNCDPQQAEVDALQHEFDEARAALDKAERQRDNPPPPGTGPTAAADDELFRKSTYQAVVDAAARQGAARINLEVAKSHLADCLAGADAACSAYIASLDDEPDTTEKVPTDTKSAAYWDYYYHHRWAWGEMPEPEGSDPRPQEPPPEPPSGEPPHIEIG
jgi:hypothetical protein